MASGLVRWPEEHSLGVTDGPGLQMGALVQVQRRSPPPPCCLWRQGLWVSPDAEGRAGRSQVSVAGTQW